MKKLLFSILTILLIGSTNAQPLYTTFTDSIRPNLPGYLDNYKILGSPENESYSLLAKYDDFMYGMLFYYAKLDVDGQIISDTVYSITPTPSTMPYPQIYSQDRYQSNISLWSSYQNLNYKDQPFILNFNEDGNINWMKYYEIDTLSFELRGGFITSDSSHITHGFVSNWNNINYGFIFKADVNGNVIWNKFYGVKYDLSSPDWYGEIKKMTETEDGGFIFSQNVNNQDSLTSSYPVFIKIDSNGDVQWTKTLEFLAPISNYNIDFITTVTGLVSVDATNVIATISVDDTLHSTINTVMISFDPSSGNVNWDKMLRFPSSDFNLNGLFKTANNNLAGRYSDANLGEVLVKWDGSFAIEKIVQNRELPIGSNLPTIFNVSNAFDGGLIYSSEISTYNGTVLFKTNNQFETSCPNTENISIFPLEEVLNYNLLTIYDTTFSVTVNTINTTLQTPQSYTQQVANPYCSCNLEVFGTVIYGGTTPDEGAFIELYQVQPDGKLILFSSTTTDVGGYYYFNYVEEGDYVVKATPSLANQTGFMPTYYNFSVGATHWTIGSSINLTCGMNPFPANIDLVEKLSQTGAWQCSGYVYEYYGHGNRVANNGGGDHIFQPGDPIGDIDITIDQSPGGAINMATTDVNGFFSFTGLNNSGTYILKADVPGFPNDSIYTLTINPGDGALDSLNFYVGADTVYILLDGFVGVDVINTNDLKVSIAPNPTLNNFKLMVNTTKNEQASISITNSLGEVLLNKQAYLNTGNNTIDFDFNQQPQGLYFMSVTIDNQHYFRKIVKQ